MKKLLLILVILIAGCTAQKVAEITPVPSNEPTATPISNVEAESEFVFGKTPGHFSNNGNPYLQKQTYEAGLPCPTDTDIFFGEDRDNIGFVYQYGLLDAEKITLEEVNSLVKTSYNNNLYLYYGKLTKITDTIYASKGSYISIWNNVKKAIPGEVDFYIIYQDDQLYYCFEDLPIEKLQTYQYHPDAHAYFTEVIAE